ncbi:MAG: hypothetical protein ACI8TQ_000498 [Planctomycetota bacterium]|jgi:hypothetical protein
MPELNFTETVFKDLEVLHTIQNLVLVLFLSQILSWHYLRYSIVLSNKRKFARILIFMAATTMIVISIVKTSVALSLGLVGALSIIRFRTPIKEPEELSYLFLAVAIGLGLGADQVVATSAMVLITLGYLALQSKSALKALGARTLVHVNVDLTTSETGDLTPEKALDLLVAEASHDARRVDLRRVDSHDTVFDANLILDLEDPSKIGPLISRVRSALPTASITIVESSSLD